MEFNVIKPFKVATLSHAQLPQGIQVDPASGKSIPLAPVITADYYKSDNTIVTRVTLLIDARVTEVWLENDEQPVVVDKALVYYQFAYNSFEEGVPNEVSVWYAEYPYTAEGYIPVVQAILRNIDPVTSRGTVTTVQES